MSGIEQPNTCLLITFERPSGRRNAMYGDLISVVEERIHSQHGCLESGLNAGKVGDEA